MSPPPPPHKETTGLLIGKKAIAEYLDISRDTFTEMMKLGMPAVVINNRYYAHHNNLELWFQAITRTQPRQDVSGAE